ncbi:sigma-70 family RNA polymerase sigma factor [Leucobacter sp. gxy201]|uniref:RNA polymerase sigma factor n=1 Tax=Leucobacter sp. gxy201 TaxID=2957200 RepID=UPI003DA0A86B
MLLATGGGRRSDDGATDAQLLTRLRAGDRDAYTLLWQRHIALALHVARSYAPGSAEDLASESFLAVYRQVAIEQKGPESAFRPYLLTTMRNLAIKWGRAGKLVDTDPDIDGVDDSDPLSQLSDEAEAGEMLAAFNDLPERWQRVLWLSEVEQVPRAEIAAEFGISRNAVSALAKRAKSGLRVQWLTKQLPPGLLADSAHPTGLIPAFVAEKGTLAATDRRSLEHHLEACARCAGLHQELRALDRRTRSTTLGVVGFAALAGIIPASGTAAGTGTAALLFGGVALGTTAAAGIGAFAVGSMLTAALVLGGVPLGTASTGAPQADGRGTTTTSGPASTDDGTQTGDDPAGSESTDTEPASGELVPPPSESPESTTPQLGRGIDDPAVQTIDLADPSTIEVGPKPAPPEPSVPSAGPGTGPASGGSTAPSPGLDPMPAAPYFIAPDITGTAAPGDEVRLRLAGSEYVVPVADDGRWRFAASSLDMQDEGAFAYEVWVVREGVASPAQSGEFVLSAPLIEGIPEGDAILLPEASTTGYVIRLTGPPNSTVFVIHAMSGSTALVPLDQTGTAVRRMRFFQTGTQMFFFTAYNGANAGPVALRSPIIDDPSGGSFDPWGAGGVSDGTVFDFVDP